MSILANSMWVYNIEEYLLKAGAVLVYDKEAHGGRKQGFNISLALVFRGLDLLFFRGMMFICS